MGTCCGSDGKVCRRTTENPPSVNGSGGVAVTASAGAFPGTFAKIVMTWPGATSIVRGVAYPAPMTTACAWHGRGPETSPTAVQANTANRVFTARVMRFIGLGLNTTLLL